MQRLLQSVERLARLAQRDAGLPAVQRALGEELVTILGVDQAHVDRALGAAIRPTASSCCATAARPSTSCAATSVPDALRWVADAGQAVTIADASRRRRAARRSWSRPMGWPPRRCCRCARATPCAPSSCSARARRARGRAERPARRQRAGRPGRHGDRAARRAAGRGDRPADRLPEPRRDARAPVRGDRPRPAPGHAAGGDDPRPRRLQARQRHLRPPDRRRAAAPRGRGAARASTAASTRSRATAATSSW